MGTAVSLEAHLHIDMFTPQNDNVKATQCQLTKDLAEIVLDITVMSGIVFVNAFQFVGPLAEMATKADDLMTVAKESGNYKEAVRAAQKLNLARNSLYYAQWALGEGRKGVSSGQNLADARLNAAGSQLPERERPRMEFPYVKNHGFCGNVFGVIDDNAVAQVDQMVVFINDHLHGLQYIGEQLFNSFFIKQQEEMGDVSLVDIMKAEDWPGDSARSYEGIES